MKSTYCILPRRLAIEVVGQGAECSQKLLSFVFQTCSKYTETTDTFFDRAQIHFNMNMFGYFFCTLIITLALDKADVLESTDDNESTDALEDTDALLRTAPFHFQPNLTPSLN
jgi:hypothetical protein